MENENDKRGVERFLDAVYNLQVIFLALWAAGFGNFAHHPWWIIMAPFLGCLGLALVLFLLSLALRAFVFILEGLGW